MGFTATAPQPQSHRSLINLNAMEESEDYTIDQKVNRCHRTVQLILLVNTIFGALVAS